MPPDSDPAADAAGWHQLHPLTPVLRSGRYAVPLVFALAQPATGFTGGRWVLLAVGIALVAGVVGGYASWRTTRYRVGPDQLEIHSGILRRQRRRLPLARLESVDIKRSLLARALGLAEVQVEAVSGGDSELVLAYLSEDRATALRATLLARRAGVAFDAPPPPEQVLAAVPMHALVATALALPVAGLAVSLVVAMAAAIVRPALGGVVLLTVLPPLVLLAVTAMARQESLYGFTVAEAPDGLRIRRGLLNLRTQTIPAGRVQAVRVEEPLLWRRWGWVRLYVDVAGYRGGQRDERHQTSLLLPVAPRDLVGPVLARVLPGLDLSAVQLVPAPPPARWRAPLSYPALGAAWTEHFAVTRRGRLRRLTDVVPHRKVQSLRVTQGPVERRLGLASLHLDTPGTSVWAAALHRDVTEAFALAGRSRELDTTHGNRAGGEPVQLT